MILIISRNIDHTADIVEDWLKKMGEPYTRLTSVDFIKNYNFSVFQQASGKRDLNIKRIKGIGADIKSGWFRKDSNYPTVEQEDNERVHNHIVQEFFRLKQIVFSNNFSSISWLGKFTSPNKIEVLYLAKEIGLLVPPFMITNSKKDLTNYLSSISSKVITKSMSEALRVQPEPGEVYFQYTKRIINDDLKEIPVKFFPTFFQIEVEKVMDVRLVYVDGTIYSCGIVSEALEAKNTDFRVGNAKGKNRYLRILTPIHVKEKITILMNKLGLNMGCIDMILDADNNFHFLEVNVLGEFSDISYNCNFNIEEKIALWLANK